MGPTNSFIGIEYIKQSFEYTHIFSFSLGIRFRCREFLKRQSRDSFRRWSVLVCSSFESQSVLGNHKVSRQDQLQFHVRIGCSFTSGSVAVSRQGQLQFHIRISCSFTSGSAAVSRQDQLQLHVRISCSFTPGSVAISRQGHLQFQVRVICSFTSGSFAVSRQGHL